MIQKQIKSLVVCGVIGFLSLGAVSTGFAAVSFYSNWNDVAALESQNKCKENTGISSCLTASALKGLWLDYENRCAEKKESESVCKAFYDTINGKSSESESFELDLATNSCTAGSKENGLIERTVSTRCRTYMQTSSRGTHARWCTICCIVVRDEKGNIRQYCPPEPHCGEWEYAPEIQVRHAPFPSSKNA